MTRKWGSAALIAAACIACYGNSLGGSFHFDDFHSIVENPAIRTLADPGRFFVDPGMFSADADKRMYRPLLLLSYALNYSLGGYEVRGYHLVNLLLHLLCSLLVWALSARLLAPGRGALFCALLFALHPLATEPVNYISSRSESLAACFYMAAFWFHLKREEKEGYRCAAWASFALGLLSKSIVLTAPLLLWAHDRWLRRRGGWKDYVPYAILSSGYVALAVHNGFLRTSLAHPVRKWSTQMWTQLKAPAYYIKLVLAPWGLNVEHQFRPSSSVAEGAVLAGLALLATLGILAWKTRRHLPGFALLWSGVVLAPTFVLPLNVLVNEHRLYLALAGFSWMCGYLLQGRRPVLLCACLPLFGLLSLERNPVWRSELSLWEDAARKAPLMYRVQTNLGRALQEAGQSAAALRAYRRALEIDADHGDVYNNIATIYHERGELDEAIHWYRQALERYPNYDEIYQNLGDAYAGEDELDKAIEMYEQALKIDARKGATWSNYGHTLYRAQKWKAAASAFQRAIELRPELPEPYNNLGNIYSGRGHFEAAVAMYRKALEKEAEPSAEVLGNLGDTYRRMRRFARARSVLQRAIAAEPQRAKWHFYLGRTEREAGAPQRARAALERAVQLDAGYVRARVELAELLSAQGHHSAAAAHFQRAVELDPHYSRAWYGKARSLEEMGEKKAAAQAYRRFLLNWPHRDRRYAEARARLAALERGP